MPETEELRLTRTRRDWRLLNPILGVGQLAYEVDTSRLKMGDGATPWESLDYIPGTLREIMTAYEWSFMHASNLTADYVKRQQFPVHVQATQPEVTPGVAHLWVQTGLGDDGQGYTFWIEDGVT